ncbi:uncharacterized protein LOC142319510 isoform X2 [Lycorma delicatula]|uniref:uncharacterized protein LOC142319510 isoform X2 n=1 Tax=Lycorma delicatula TaxID=130591 RepID=UPI003F50D751
MQHIRPTGKGDPLCPLGFHPQVRWPTRCKRCFRDYKEHGNRNKEVESLRRDDTTASSPALSSWSSRSREDSKNDSGTGTRSWTSSSNLSNSVSNLSSSSSKLSDASSNTNSATTGFSKAASSWTSTPNLTNLKDDSQLVTTVNLTLPRRRPKPVDTGQDDDDYRRTQYTVRRRTSTSLSSDSSPSSSSSSSSSWTPRSTVTASATITPAYSSRASRTPERRTPEVTPPPSTASKPPEKTSKADLDFMIQVKSTKPPKAPTKKTTKKQEPSTAAASSSSSEDDDDDDSSVAATDTTEATLVNETSEMQEQIDSLKQELETMKARCEKAEREKSDIMLRRIASLDTASTKTAASENLKLQQKLNELKTTVEDLRDDKRSLSLRVKELEADMEKLKTVQEVEKEAETLRAKLQAAETLCEELMDENEDMKRELRDLEEEMDEMQDNFREEQADEYTSLKKELEQTAKNCRILSFKLRKAERKMESVEAEKQEVEKKCLEMAGGKAGLDKAERIRTLEQELAVANEVAQRLQKELEETKQKAKCASEKNEKSATKKKAPMLGSIGKISSGERVSRESLTRGGSQEDPVQLLRDLQDSMEREADLREQLRYAEEEILKLQLKKKRHVISPGVHPDVVPAKQLIAEARGAFSNSTQTALTRLTSLASQVVSLQTQTDILVDEQVQTVGLLSEDKQLQTVCSVMCSSVQTDSPLIIDADCNTEQLLSCDQSTITDLTSNYVTLGVQVNEEDINKTSKVEAKLVSVRNSVSTQCPSNESFKLDYDNSVAKENGNLYSSELFKNLISYRNRCRFNNSMHYSVGCDLTNIRSNSCPMNLNNINLVTEIGTQTDEMNIFQPVTHFSLGLPFSPFLSTAVRSSPLATLLSPLAVRRHSPSASRLTPEPPQEKDEGISDEDDPAELRLLLELNEQEAAVLRRKVEELEGEGNSLKRKVKELQEKLTAKSDNRSTLQKQTSETGKTNPIYEQKIKVFEEEMNDLRKKLLVKERDCERLHAEISLSQKKPKTLQKSKSLDASSEALDLKRQLQVVEQEASVLRTRNQNLESDNEKLVAENKRMMLTRGTKKTSASDSSALIELKEKVNTLEKQLEEANKKVEKYESDKGKNSTPVKKDGKEVSLAEFDKLKSQLMKVESEKVKLKDSLIRLKEEAMADIATFYHKRTPKKPTDLTTKLQLKKMVDDLESEIGEVLVALRKSEKERKESIKTPKEDITSTKLKSEIEELNKKLEETQKELKQEKNKADKELDKLQKEIKRLEEDKRKEENEKEKLKKQFDEEKKKSLSEKETVNKLKAEIESCKAAKEEGTRLKKEIEKLNNEIKEEQKKCSEVQKQLEIAQKTDQDRSKLIKDIGDKTKKLNEAEKKTKELEEKLKKSDRLVGSKKEKITKLEKEESNIKHERDKASDLTVKVGSAASRDIAQLKEELTSAKSSIQQFKDKLDKSEEEKKSLEKSLKESESKIEKEIAEWENKASELEMDLQAERKLIERLKASHDKEINTKDAEIVALKAKASQTVGKKLTEMKQEMQAKIDKLELALESEKHEYDELTSKYELLEEEHVVTKAQFVREREDIQGQLVTTQTELVGIETELRTLRDTYNNKQDDWIKEKLEFQNKLQELEEKADQETWVLEKIRLNAICEEKASEIDTLRRENMTQVEQIECMRKENDELRRKLEDYDKVVKVQRSYSSDTSNIERELRETKNKLYMEEKARKTELSAMKLSYDNRVSVITSELKSSQAQVSRFKRERDTFRHMLEAAQKNIAELKAAGPRTPSSGTASPEESEELHSQIATLEQQISCMEDELSESRLEASRLKTELVSERSAWEVKLSELNSKINELEEDRLLSTGRTKISGLKTRMELAWHKEREEQQRLLQEASTLARDLRQTLFEVERERDKERLEAKRKLEQMKKTVEEEQEENRKKLNEMQCDLLELRDAHAKLRTTNEKLRREKERSEKERDLMKQASVTKRRNDQDDERKVAALVRLVDELMTDAPELFPSKTAPTSLTVPTPPVRRKGPKSRESSPAIEREPSEEPKSTNLQNTLKRLSEAVEELRRDQRRSEDRERLGQARKSFSNRRAASTESENPPEAFGVGNGNKGLQRKGSLFRKSLSLEQTSATSHEMGIWKTEDETEGSLTSIQSLDEAYEAKFMRRDPSLDSRLSGGSTQSEVITSSTEKKKKKGLFGKLKKLTKSSRSIDQDGSDYGGGSASQLDQGSDTSLSTVPDAEHISKRDLKDRLTGIFKKSGSTSRGNSLERNAKPPVSGGNEQRPLSRVSSSNTLPRASPARSDASQTSSSTARPLGGVSPGSVPLQRKVKPK